MTDEKKKAKKVKTPKRPKVIKSEEQLVKEYADKIINGKIARGHYDKRFDWHKRNEGNTNKDLWLDTDFFFSVVFQSSEQKYQFLKQFCEKFNIKVETSEDEKIEIVNGVKLAQNLDIAIRKESMLEYPYGDIDLRPFVLDNEKL